MDNTAGETTNSKYRFVIEETTKEVNRVLTVWENTNSNNKNFEVKSMFKSYLSKFLNHKFDWRQYARVLKKFDPLPIINNNKLVGISLSSTQFALSVDKYVRDEFQACIDEFDFEGFNKKWDAENQDLANPINYEISKLEDIDLNSIKNIKF